eukprot:761535-Rhodomonas_salina.1
MMRERERARRAAKERRGEAGGGKKKGGGGKDSGGLVDDDVGVVHYHSMDATSLSFSDASFNAVRPAPAKSMTLRMSLISQENVIDLAGECQIKDILPTKCSAKRCPVFALAVRVT